MPEPSTRKSTRMRSSAMPGHVRSKDRFYQRTGKSLLARSREAVIRLPGLAVPTSVPAPLLSQKGLSMSWPCLGLPLLLLALGTAGEPEEKKPVPVYTNDDLDRDRAPSVTRPGSARRVTVPVARPSPTRGADDGRARSEAYWRREADSLRVRLQRVARAHRRPARAHRGAARRKRTRALRSTSRRGPPAPRAPRQLEAWRRQIAAMEARIRESEDATSRTARGARAPCPGWLR